MNRAYTSRTYAELSALTADLPAGAVPTVYAMPVYQPPVTTNSLARAALVLGVAEFFTMGLTAIPAIICGHMAKREMRQTGQRGDGLATSGLVLGYMAVIFWGILIVLSIVGAVISATGTPGGCGSEFLRRGCCPRSAAAAMIPPGNWKDAPWLTWIQLLSCGYNQRGWFRAGNVFAYSRALMCLARTTANGPI